MLRFQNFSSLDLDQKPWFFKALWLLKLPILFKEDYEAGKFNNYRGYTTLTGIDIHTIEEAIQFNTFHEGIHYGVVKSIQKLIT